MGSGVGALSIKHPSFSAALVGVALTLLWPVHDAFAGRTRHQSKRPPKSVAARPITPPTPAAALMLAGTYALTSMNGRTVRNADFAKSVVTFSPNGDVSVQTACNRFGTLLQARGAPGQILGFSQTVHTTLSCTPSTLEAEVGTTRLFRDTANIARAGSSVTFFNANGVTIAQWTAVAPAANAAGASQQPASQPPTKAPPEPERAVPPRGEPTPTRVYFGDYVLSELNGNAIGGPTPSPSQPSLFLRETGTVTGSSGCNRYNSTLVQQADGTNRFGPIVSTRKACLNRATRTLETTYFGVLRRATRVEIGSTGVDVFAPNGQRTARLSDMSGRQGGPSLYGKTWVLRRLNNVAIGTTSAPTILFVGSQASGSTGCNSYTIDHQRRNDRSRFSGGIMTQMACVATRGNGLEGRYMSALGRISTLSVTTTTLTMRSADRRTVMVFAAQ